MILNDGVYIKTDAIVANLKRITNQIYKLLPNREEEIDWQIPLTTILEELKGMNRIINNHEILFSLICKLEGLFLLINKTDFFLYRRTIFECLNLISNLKDDLICKD